VLYEHCAIYGEYQKAIKNKMNVDVIFDQYFQDGYPQFRNSSTDKWKQAVQYVCTTYMTNFLNSLRFPFENRLQRFIRCYLNSNYNVDNKFLATTIKNCIIYGYPFTVENIEKVYHIDEIMVEITKYNTSVTNKHQLAGLLQDFITQERKFLLLGEDYEDYPLPVEDPQIRHSSRRPQTTVLQHKQLDAEILATTVISDDWIQKHYTNIVVYYFRILKRMEVMNNINPKLFTIAPISNVRRHFLTIDGRILYELLRKSGLIEDGVSEDTFDASEYFQSYFQTDELINNEDYLFDNLLMTDGISLCTHFTRQQEDSTIYNNDRDSQFYTDEMEHNDYETYSRKIAIDPGRTNIIYGVERVFNPNTNSYDNKVYKMTRKQYYCKAGNTYIYIYIYI
jgi:hypothetical protein